MIQEEGTAESTLPESTMGGRRLQQARWQRLLGEPAHCSPSIAYPSTHTPPASSPRSLFCPAAGHCPPQGRACR